MRDATHNPLDLGWIQAACKVVRRWVRPPAANSGTCRAGSEKKLLLGATVAAGMLALSVNPAMADVSRLNSWTSTSQQAFPTNTVIVDNYTVPSGSNRLLVVAISSVQSPAAAQSALPDVFFGTQALTAVVHDLGAVSLQHTYLYYLNEAGIVAANQAPVPVGDRNDLRVTVNGAGTSRSNIIFRAVFAGVDQSTPILAVNGSKNYNSGASNNTVVGPFDLASPPLAVGAGNLAVEVVSLTRNAGNNSARTLSTVNPAWTSEASVNFSSGDNRSRAYMLQSISDDTTYSEHAASDTTLDSMSAMTLKAAPTAPVITSAGSTTFTALTLGAFTVTATGSRPITFAQGGALPPGVVFDPATGLLFGTPAANSLPSYSLTFTATNGVGTSTVQDFTLNITTAGANSARRGVVHTYENTASATINNNSCPNGATQTFTVPDSFTVGGAGSISIGVEVSHPLRNELTLTLTPPTGSAITLQSAGGGAVANLNVMYTTNTEDNGVNEVTNDLDPLDLSGGTIHYRRFITVPNLDAGNGTAFYTGVSNGTWTLQVCDSGGTNNSGTLLRSRLVLVEAAASISTAVCTTKSTYDWALNENDIVFDSATVGEVTITEIGPRTEAVSGDVPSFRTYTDNFGGEDGYYQMLMNMSTAPGTTDSERAAERAVFSFSTPVMGLRFAVGDIDIKNTTVEFEDYVRIEPFDDGGNPVPYQMSIISTANNGFAGDWVEGDTDNITDGSANVVYQFDSPVKSFNLIYAQGTRPESEPSNQGIALLDLSFCAYDYGDAPSTYGTATARHGLNDRTELFIGASAPDGEAVALPGATATSDGADEGTVVFLPYAGAEPGADKSSPAPSVMTCSGYTTTQGDYCQTLTVTNTLPNLPGNDAQLVGFIDFNGDGDFLDAGERSLPNLGGASFAGATDGTWATGNIAPNPAAQTVVLVWSGFAPPTTNATLARFRLTTDALFKNNANPPVADAVVANGEIEDHTISAGTLPVTLAYLEATRIDSQTIRVLWSTATETGTMGYRVLQEAAGGIMPLGSDLTPSHDLSSTRPSEYEATFTTSSNGPIYLEELSASGQTERFGPFQLGTAFGAQQVLTPVPWADVRNEMRSHATVDRQARSERAAQRGTIAAEILVKQSGLQQVTVADLLTAGVSFIGQPVSALRLSRGSAVVPVRVVGGQVVNSDSVLEFYGEAVEGSLYTKARPYVLQVASGGAEWRQVSGTPVPGASSRQSRREASLDQDRLYTVSAANGDPWYFDVVARTSATMVSKQWTLVLADVDVERRAELVLDLTGGSSYPNLAVDHHYRVSFNGVPLGSVLFDGITAHQAVLDMPGALLRTGNNVVRMESVATGQQIDRVYIDRITVRHHSLMKADGGRMHVDLLDVTTVSEGIFGSDFSTGLATALACGSGCGQMEVGGFSDSDIVALQVTEAGSVELTDFELTENAGQWAARVRPLLVETGDSGPALTGRLVLTERRNAFRPEVQPALALDHPLAGGAADLLVIASSRFAGSVDALVTARQAEGLRVRVVEVAQIYEHYSEGIVDPQAIRAFVAAAYQQLSTRYVLLVGGDTYDYFDRLALGSVSDVPTVYTPTHEFVSFAPIDGEYGDINGDGSPELAIGRLPARTSAELASMIAKILQPLPANPNTLVFVSERANAAEGINYAQQTEALIGTLGPAWQSGAARIRLDDYPATPAGTALARTDLMSQITLGRNWVSFYGHASPATWSRESLLQGSQLGGLLDNAGKAPLVTEFGCWGGYFVEPTYTTMNHAWLLTQDRGARAMIASSSLTETASDKAIANALISELAVPGVRLGDALVNAKRTVWNRAPEMRDVVLGMSLFGDPTARLTPAN